MESTQQAVVNYGFYVWARFDPRLDEDDQEALVYRWLEEAVEPNSLETSVGAVGEPVRRAWSGVQFPQRG